MNSVSYLDYCVFVSFFEFSKKINRVSPWFPNQYENYIEEKTFIFWNILQLPVVRFSSSVGKGQLKKVGFVSSNYIDSIDKNKLLWYNPFWY